MKRDTLCTPFNSYRAIYFNNYTHGDNSHISEIDVYVFQEAVMRILNGTKKLYNKYRW